MQEDYEASDPEWSGTRGISNHHQGIKIPGKGIEIVASIRNEESILIPKILQGTDKTFPMYLFQFHPENELNATNTAYMDSYFTRVKEYPNYQYPE